MLVRQVFDFEFDSNKHNLTSISPCSTMEDQYKKNESLSEDDNFSLESDECDYNSDSSLGSTNSLYLCLKNNSTLINTNRTNFVNEKQSLPRNSKLSKTVDTNRHNIVTRIGTIDTRKFYGIAKDEKSKGKWRTSFFCEKQVSYIGNFKT